jgi:uncharacterized protein (TIGR03435 family)
MSIYETAHYGTREMGMERSVHALLKMNQKDGFDCPSCAWPDPDGKRKTAEFCENGAKALASEATTKHLTPEVFAQHPISALAEHSDAWLETLGRITHPMIRRKNSDFYEPISWDDAFNLIGTELRALASPDEASFYTSGRASNEAAFVYGLFARQFGTNNLPDCSNMCHESSGAGLTEVIGFGKATVAIEDFSHADAIFVIGQNPGTCHPRMLTELQKAVRNGCKIVSVNPLLESGMMHFKNPQEPFRMLGHGTDIACLFLPVRINGDVALLKGIMKEMLEEHERTGGKVLAHDYIQHHTEGFEAFARDIRNEIWDKIVEASGVSRDLIHQAARIAISSERMICSWAMGITQHRNGVANVQSIVNFALLRGQMGRPGGEYVQCVGTAMYRAIEPRARARNRERKPNSRLQSPGSEEQSGVHPARFEVASIKPIEPSTRIAPSRSATEVRFVGPLRNLIVQAFLITPNSANDVIIGLPKSADTQLWDITAKLPSAGEGSLIGGGARPVPPTRSVLMEMLQGLLAEQFELKTHTENREVTVYAMTLPGKPKMTQADGTERSECPADPLAVKPYPNMGTMVSCRNMTMSDFAENLNQATGFFDHPIVDATGLKGGWNFKIGWSRVNMAPAQGAAAVEAANPDTLTSYEAVERQMGVKLVKQKRSIPVIIVDHVDEKPIE